MDSLRFTLSSSMVFLSIINILFICIFSSLWFIMTYYRLLWLHIPSASCFHSLQVFLQICFLSDGHHFSQMFEWRDAKPTITMISSTLFPYQPSWRSSYDSIWQCTSWLHSVFKPHWCKVVEVLCESRKTWRDPQNKIKHCDKWKTI